MSGAWAEACDGWAARLPYLDDMRQEAPVLAVYWLAEALMDCGTRQRREAVETTGAYVRAWRKSLPGQSDRAGDRSDQMTDEALLWSALGSIQRAWLWPHPRAVNLRFVEADLRTWWKRQQGRVTGLSQEAGS